MASQLDPSPPREETDEKLNVVYFTGGNVWLSEETLRHIHDQLFALAEEPGPSALLIDFGNVEYISSKALGMLVTLHKKLLGKGRHLSIRNLSPQVLEVFTVTRLDKLLDLLSADASEASAAGGRTRSPAGVLIVDDDASIRRMLAFGLRNVGFAVQVAAHGNEALDLYRRHRNAIAVVLLDVLMPGLDGPQTLTALQQFNPNVRCCFMTGNLNPYTEEALLQRGAVRVFHKPFALTEVIDTLERLAGQSPQPQQDHWIEIPLSRSVKDVGFES